MTPPLERFPLTFPSGRSWWFPKNRTTSSFFSFSAVTEFFPDMTHLPTFSRQRASFFRCADARPSIVILPSGARGPPPELRFEKNRSERFSRRPPSRPLRRRNNFCAQTPKPHQAFPPYNGAFCFYEQQCHPPRRARPLFSIVGKVEVDMQRTNPPQWPPAGEGVSLTAPCYFACPWSYLIACEAFFPSAPYTFSLLRAFPSWDTSSTFCLSMSEPYAELNGH